ncbi:MAG TPA: non-homologous end-joining DNA ligase [Polyangia bacterium]|nr:non-homologous end-joining DNA ligase [Polyangia bacterium]
MRRGTPERERVPVAGVSISHPDRVIFPDLGLTKLDVARYYDDVADRMLRHVVGRPLTLLRCAGPIDPAAEKGGCTMLRHGKAWGPSAIRRVRIRELHKTGEYLVADNRTALVGLAQMGVVEIHTWNARAEAPYEHDRVVVDLDPGPDVPWADVVAAAHHVRQMLVDVRLKSWVKTTGGMGLHVVAPIQPTDVDACLSFARSFAAALVRDAPARFTTANAKAGRERQILLDVLRNNRTNTSVAAYALRARAGAPVSFPIAWDDLTARLRPTAFTLASVRERARRDPDAWSDYWTARQRLPALRPQS